jgi:hypothetical protein
VFVPQNPNHSPAAQGNAAKESAGEREEDPAPVGVPLDDSARRRRHRRFVLNPSKLPTAVVYGVLQPVQLP